MGQNRERFERELHRIRGYRFKRLLVVGSEAEILAGHYHSNIKPSAVLATGGRSISPERRLRPSTNFGERNLADV